MMMNVMAGFDERDSTSLNRPKEDYTRGLSNMQTDKPLKGLRIGLPKEYFADGLEANVEAVVRAAIAEYQKARCRN